MASKEESPEENQGWFGFNYPKWWTDLVRALENRMDYIDEEIWDKIETTIFDEEMKEDLDVVWSILEKLRQSKSPKGPFRKPRLALLALVKRTQEYVFEKNPPSQKLADLTEKEFSTAKKMCQFALNVYDASFLVNPREIHVKMGLNHTAMVLQTGFKEVENEYCPKYVIFMDDVSKSIVLAIRGTFCFNDVIVDLVCEEEKFLDGFAHSGILLGAKRILMKCEKMLKVSMESSPDYKLVITGHSLGAGAAILISLAILNGETSIDSNKVQLKCYALAPPPVFRSENIEKYQDKIDIFINENDCVPRLSLANIAKLLAIMEAIDDIELPLKDQIMIYGGFKDTPYLLEDFKELVKIVTETEQDQFPRLEIPGRVFHFCRSKNKLHPSRFRLYTNSQDFFSDSLLLLKRMILNHLQPAYEDALNNVIWR